MSGGRGYRGPHPDQKRLPLLFANLLEGFIKGNGFAVYCLLVSSFHHCVELRVRHSVAGGHIRGLACHDDHLRLCAE